MMTRFLKKLIGLRVRDDGVMAFPDMRRIALQDIQKSYARLFATEDGQAVLAHLQRTVFMRACGADCNDAQIRYAEGQRALLFQIMRHIEGGRKPSA
ncbi:MAG: hypothetical protein QF692_08235 [Alphaproteobacteria bacterium]|jgi:hypothetical protein|nr:hypothetical protein [Alphaproteobacteria bacterium]MDP7223233.1 hypothetical protein [Alphaproteobacteria bacterium]